eukprot:2059288-Pleurochrysis_carterae.AAC.1
MTAVEAEAVAEKMADLAVQLEAEAGEGTEAAAEAAEAAAEAAAAEEEEEAETEAASLEARVLLESELANLRTHIDVARRMRDETELRSALDLALLAVEITHAESTASQLRIVTLQPEQEARHGDVDLTSNEPDGACAVKAVVARRGQGRTWGLLGAGARGG